MKWAIRRIKPSKNEDLSGSIEAIQEAGWSRAQILSSLGDPLARTWVAHIPEEGSAEVGGWEPPDSGEMDGGAAGALPSVVQGFVLARRVSDLLEIDLVGVRPSMRRRGIARRLLAALIAEEGQTGLAETRLELVAANEAARLLYEGLGFVVVGRRTRYYPDGDDALMLSRFRT